MSVTGEVTGEVTTGVEQATHSIVSFIGQLPGILIRLLMAGAVIAIGMALLALLRKFINRKIKRKFAADPFIAKQTQTFRSLAGSVVGYLVYFLIALVVLRIFGVDLASVLAVAGIGSIAVGFGAQSLVKDVISGLFLWVEGNIAVGDVITAAGYTGTVEAISLRTTILHGADGTRYAIPNGDIRTVASKSRGSMLAQVNVTLAHGQDMDKAQAALADECGILAQRLNLKEKPYVVGCILNDARCVTVRVECPCAADDCWALEREMRLAMFERLRKEEFRP